MIASYRSQRRRWSAAAVFVAAAVVLLLSVVVVVVRARNSCAFFSNWPKQNVAQCNSLQCEWARKRIYMCVCVHECVYQLYIWAMQRAWPTYLCFMYHNILARARACYFCLHCPLTPTHHCTHMYIHVCVCECLICIQSEFQLTFEFCTICNANVMLTAAERTLSITMRALSFLSLSRAVPIKCHACDKMINPEKRARELRPTGNRIINLNAWLDCAHIQAKKAITKQVQMYIPLVTN